MFDISKQFNIPTLDGSKRCLVRYPKDEEWCARARSMKTIRRDLGRAKSVYEHPNARKVESDLFAKIRLDKDGPAFSEAEAARVIGRLDTCRLESVQRLDAKRYQVVLKVPGGLTTHILRIPSEDDIEDFGDGTAKTEFGRGSSEIRVFLEPAGPLYDRYIDSTDGYTGVVPINHKLAVVKEVIEHLTLEFEKQFDDGLDPEV